MLGQAEIEHDEVVAPARREPQPLEPVVHEVCLIAVLFEARA